MAPVLTIPNAPAAAPAGGMSGARKPQDVGPKGVQKPKISSSKPTSSGTKSSPQTKPGKGAKAETTAGATAAAIEATIPQIADGKPEKAAFAAVIKGVEAKVAKSPPQPAAPAAKTAHAPSKPVLAGGWNRTEGVARAVSVKERAVPAAPEAPAPTKRGTDAVPHPAAKAGAPGRVPVPAQAVATKAVATKHVTAPVPEVAPDGTPSTRAAPGAARRAAVAFQASDAPRESRPSATPVNAKIQAAKGIQAPDRPAPPKPTAPSPATPLAAAPAPEAAAAARIAAPAASQAPEARPTGGPTLTDQVAEAIRGGEIRDGRELVVQLRPPELGRVRITLRIEGEELRGELRVDQPATLARLEREAVGLVDRLQDAGVQMRRLDVALNDTGGQGGGQGGPSHGGEQGGTFADDLSHAAGDRAAGPTRAEDASEDEPADLVTDEAVDVEI